MSADLSPERLAEINRRRRNPLEGAVPVEEMVRMLEERRATEAAKVRHGSSNAKTSQMKSPREALEHVLEQDAELFEKLREYGD